MSWLRRALAVVAAAAALSAHADSSRNIVDVVKIMSFSCGFCLAAEAHDPAIENAVKTAGGKFVRAPVPVLEEDTGAREMLYYASREMGPEFANRVKVSLYKGAQDAEVSLYNFMQVYAWVTQDLSADEPKFQELFKRAQSKEGKDALARAARLASAAGVSSLPSYVIMVNGSIKAVLDNSSEAGSSMANLRNNVISKIESLSKPNANSTAP